MKIVHTLAAAACLLTSVPLLAGAQAPASSQEPATAPQTQPQTAPQATPETQPPTQAEPSSPRASTASSPDAAMKAVNCELVDKLDSKTAKTGDSIVVKTRATVKTADGTEIPKGTKLMGHITAVKASGDAHENSEVALAFDTAQLKGGQTVPIHSEIQSLSPAGGSSANDTSASMGAGSAPSAPSAGGSAPSGMNGSGGGANASASGGAAQTPSSPSAGSAPSAQASGPAPGTVVATTGNIAIRATAIPGVMLAGNQPGQKDPRMGQSSGILLGAKQDIRLDGGTELVLNVAPAATTGGTR